MNDPAATDVTRSRSILAQRIGLIAFVVVMIAGAVVRSAGNSAGTTLLEIGAALLIVTFVLFLVGRTLGGNSDALADLRRTEPTAYACYLENGKRGIVSVAGGSLILRRFKGRALVELARIPAGDYTITPARVQITAARQVDGIAISTPAGEGVRIALSQDKMTVTGSMLKGAELDAAATRLAVG